MARRATQVALAVGLLLGSQATQAELRVVVLGDHGRSPLETRQAPNGLLAVAAGLRALQARATKKVDLLVFLGDNFYPRGLNEEGWAAKVEQVLGPFRNADGKILGLSRDRVHAVAGNHDYYQFKVLGFPTGFTFTGNRRAAELPEWTYHFWWPQVLVLPADAEVAAELYFFDSARPVALGADEAESEYEVLERLLAASPVEGAFRWRLLLAHHPLATVGAHGAQGTPCGRWSLRRRLQSWAMRAFGGGSQDLCTAGYQAYVGSAGSAVAASGRAVQLAVAGHDHSLQLLGAPDARRPLGPAVQLVSGAGWEATGVAGPDASAQRFTSPSLGFAVLDLGADRIRVRFVGPDGLLPLNVGGACELWIGRDGRLSVPEPRAGACPAVDW